MMTRFFVHDDQGTILRSGVCQLETVSDQAQTGETAVATEVDPDGKYLDTATSTLVELQSIELSVNKTAIVADGDDLLVVEGLPVGTVVSTMEGAFTIDDGTFEFTTTIAGRYVFLFSALHYRQKRIEIDAA